MSGHDRRASSGASSTDARTSAGPGPGKQTLVQLLESSPATAARGTGQAQGAPGKVIELHGAAAAAKLAALGGRLVTDPDYADGRKAIVGSHLQYTVVGPTSRTIRLGVHQWTHDGPDGFHMQSITGVGRPDPIPSAAAGPNGLFVNAHDVGSTTIPLAKPGTYRTQAWVRAGVDEQGAFVGYELHVDHVVEVTHLERALHDADRKQPRAPESFDQFRDTMSIRSALLRPGDAAAQGHAHALAIATSAPNPSPVSQASLGFRVRDDRQDPKPLTYHWYVSAQGAAATLPGRPLVEVGGRRGYDFGTGSAIALPAAHAGLWVVWYRATDAAGHDAGEASYLQTILGDVKSLEQHDAYLARVDEAAGKIQGEKLPLRAVHVAEATGSATELRLFVGRDAAGFVLIDATPGVDPKANRLEYASASGPGTLDEFFRLNRYPKGRLRLNAPPNQLGIDTHMIERETSGQGELDRTAARLGAGGMVALGIGILAAPITRGQSLQVMMVVAGGLNAAAGAVSLYERLHHAEVSGTGVALDVVAIASGLLNAGGAVRSLAAGPGILLANRATKFLLWTNVVADGANGLLIGAEGVQQLADVIDNDQLRPEQKREAVVRIVTNLVMAEALLAVSYGQLHELRGKVESVLGKAVAGKLGDDACLGLALLDDATLRTAKAAAPPELTKLGRALRDEPALVNLVRAERRLPAVLLLMTDGTAEDLRFAILRANAHEAGASAATSARLVAALVEAKVSSTAALGLGKDLLVRFTEPAALMELEHVAKLQSSGRIQGLGDWLAFGAKKTQLDLTNVVFELREAQRQAATNPKKVIHVGGDNQAPLRSSGERMQSFDQTVTSSRGAVEKSIEVTTVGRPIRGDADISDALEHGTKKVDSRAGDGAPIPGEHHLAIYGELGPPVSDKSGRQVIEPNGDRMLYTKGGQIVKQGNLFEKIIQRLNKTGASQLLDHVTIIDRKTGREIVEFHRNPASGAWSLVRN
jgi:hypothetical protein